MLALEPSIVENTIIKAMSGNFKACVQNGCMSSSLLFSSLLSSPPLPLNLSFLYSIVPRAQRAAKHHCIPSGTTSPIPPFFLPLFNTITLSLSFPLLSPLPLSPLPSPLFPLLSSLLSFRCIQPPGYRCRLPLRTRVRGTC